MQSRCKAKYTVIGYFTGCQIFTSIFSIESSNQSKSSPKHPLSSRNEQCRILVDTACLSELLSVLEENTVNYRIAAPDRWRNFWINAPDGYSVIYGSLEQCLHQLCRSSTVLSLSSITHLLISTLQTFKNNPLSIEPVLSCCLGAFSVLWYKERGWKRFNSVIKLWRGKLWAEK